MYIARLVVHCDSTINMLSDIQIRPISPTQTHHLRHTVLWPEKPISFVQLPEDDYGQHFGAFSSSSDPPLLVGVISLFIVPPVGDTYSSPSARFRKMCVLPSHQSRGIGSQLVLHVVNISAKIGASSIWCDARATASPFYGRLGLKPEGESFDKSGVEYIVMRRHMSIQSSASASV